MKINIEALQIKVVLGGIKTFINREHYDFAIMGCNTLLLFLKAMIPIPSEIHNDFTLEIINSLRHTTQWVIYDLNHKCSEEALSCCDLMIDIINKLINYKPHSFEKIIPDIKKKKPLINVLLNGEWEINKDAEDSLE